ncbi:MAG: DegT/DnrJ/EryC1/StrS family aminotransferase [Kiritimatiellia bacterium]
MATKTTKVERLAIDGGKQVWTKGFPAWPQFDRKTDKKVLDILHSGKVSYRTGPVGMQFETAWAKWLGVRNAISVSNGTAALHVALTALGVGSGDEVICTSYSFIASSFCALQTGALPVFCDVGADHLLDPGKIEACITRRTKAIVVVHLYGMVCCNDDGLAREVRSIRDHGYDVRARLDLLQTAGRRLYVHRCVGYNFRMTEIQSAIGLGELRRFDTWSLPQRKKLGKALIKGLAGHPLVKYAPVDTEERQNAFWLVPFVLDTSKLKCTMRAFIAAVQAEGACAYSVQWPEMYKEEAFAKRRGFGTANYPFRDPAHRRIDYTKFNCKTAHSMADATISFWTHPTYTLAHIKADVAAFKKVAAAMMK